MKLVHHIAMVAILRFVFHGFGVARTDDYGIGYVVPHGGDKMSAVIYSKPNPKSDTLATLYHGEFTFKSSTKSVRGRLVGFEKYDYWGLPLLSITGDSSWAHVLVESSDGIIRTKGWVELRTPNTSLRIWADFLPTKSMILRDDIPLQFCSKPNKNTPRKIKLYRRPNKNEYSYILRPIRREGRWLLVELQTPFDPCGNIPEVIEQDYGGRPRTLPVWIEYIDKQGRPLVRAPMMC